MDILDWAWNSPQIVLWIAPVLFAVAVLFDNDFIGSGIYQRQMDGVVISALIGGLVPLALLAPFINYNHLFSIQPSILITAVAGGLLYCGHLYFYFNVLFTSDHRGRPINDGAGVELFINLNVLFVPLCAWLLLDQDLTVSQWTGVVVILAAALLMSGIRCIKSTLMSGIMTALLLAAYYLCEDHIYNYISLKYGVFIFSLTTTVVGVALFISPSTRPNASVFNRKNLLRFLIAELTTIAAVVASQQALRMNPVVYVIAVESFAPIFVAVLSLLPTAFVAMKTKYRQVDQRTITNQLSTWSTQRENLLVKTCSAVIMVGGTVLLLQ